MPTLRRSWIRRLFRPVTRRPGLGVHRLEARVVPAAFTVTSLADTLTAGTLRQAIADANGNGAGLDTITFDIPAGGTILLGNELAVNGSVQIDGPATRNIVISGNNTVRLFNTSAAPVSSVVSFARLTLTGGKATVDGGAVLADDQVLNFTDCVIDKNTTTANGGAIAFGATSVGRLNLLRSSVTGNTAGSDGGAVYFYSGGGFVIDDSTISGNTASGAGNDGGGAIYFYGSAATMEISNSTIANNAASNGGAIHLQNFSGTLSVFSSTISGNTATTGNAGGINRFSGSGNIFMESCIVAGNVATANANDDLFTTGTVTAKFSAVGTTTGVGTFNGDATTNTLLGQNFKLGTLGNNGGPTLTIRPANDSPVVNQGSNPNSLATDQRGIARIWGTAADIGAVETTATLTVINANDSGAGSLRQAILDANLDVNSSSTIGFDAAFFASAKTITLTTDELTISDALTINGTGFDKLTLSGNNARRIFNTSSAANGTSITLAGMTLTKGSTAGDGGAIFVGEEVLTINNCVITNNTSAGDGGGINVESSSSTTLARLVLDGSTVSGNTAASAGGGIYFFDSGSFLIRNSTVSGNRAQSSTGGGLYFFGSATAGGAVISQSTLSGNSAAGSGGAVVLLGSSGAGTLLVQSCTIVDNTGSTGGGIARSAGAFAIDVQSSIISGNTGTNPDISSPGTVTAKFSAIGSNTGFTLTDQGNNLPFQPHANLLLGPLITTGTASGFFHAPGILSPLVDAGSNPGGLTNDQRGEFRTIGVQPDIGTVEIRNFVVLTIANSGPGSLRQAVEHANSVPGADTVTFDPAVFSSAQTITLAGVLTLSDAITVAGPGARLVTISGNNATRILTVDTPLSNQPVQLSGLTFLGGKAGQFGAIANVDEALSLIDCTVTGNTATSVGGALGVYVDPGSLTLIGCTITGNTAAAGGGALYVNNGFGGLTVRNCTISTNSSGGNGGAIVSFAVNTIIQNSTIVNNTAGGQGGALSLPNSGPSIESSVVSGNAAATGPDIVGNTVVVKNSALGSTSGFTLNDQGGNILNQPHANLKLGVLANNGGPTQTILPLPGSPLVDAGSNPALLTNDQRGVQRVVGTKADIGAAEAVNLVVLNTNDAGSGSLRQTLEHANSVAGADTVIFDPTVFASAQTIKLASFLTISDAMTVTGPGARLVRVSGNFVTDVLRMDTPLSAQAITISGVTIADGKSNVNAGFFNSDEAVTFRDCTFANNFGTTAQGVGIVATAPGTLLFEGCTITGNSAAGSVGAIGGNAGTTITVRNSTFTNNTSGGTGGAILQNGSLIVQNSTFVGNTATIQGGAIVVGGTASIESTIVSGNTSPLGADIRGNTVSIANSAIGSTAGFTIDDKGGNILNQPHASLKLGMLANNGGPTDTILPAHDSPLVGKGSNPAALANDQRGVGFGRVRGTIDIGAVEAATNFVVLNAADAGPGSLRQAVLDANAFVGADSITFDPTFFATAQTITLGGTDMAINESVTITGPGASLASIDGAAKSRIFFIANNQNATISGLSFRNGLSGGGGAIRANGNNSLTISDSAFINNTSSTGGGGAFTTVGGSLNVSRSTFSGNLAATGGGAINALGDVTIDSSTFFNNAVTANNFGGGAINFRSGPNTWLVRNSTISNNSTVSNGGGIGLESGTGTLTVQNCTIVGNTAQGQGGGIGRYGSTVTISVTSTILSGNTAAVAGPDIFTTGTVNATTTLLGSAAGITTINADATTTLLLGKAANLGPLANNGGPTQTHALLAGSAAIGQGSNPAPALTLDQRGRNRVVGNIDIGAFELQPAAKVTSVVVGDGTIQRSTVRQLVVTFDSPVTFVGTPDNAFTLTRQGDSAIVNLAVAMNPAGTTATITFTGGATQFGSLADGRYTLGIIAAQIGADGLDGNGDGTGGDNYALVGAPGSGPNLFRLFGDADGSGQVTSSDFLAFRLAFLSASPVFDFNSSGNVDSTDFLQFRLQFLKSI